MALITLERAQMIPSLAGAAPAYLQLLLNAASNLIERYCRRVFTETVYSDEIHDGEGTYVLMLRHFPITALTTVKTVEPDGTEVSCAGTEFRTDALIGEIRPKPDCTCNYCFFPSGYRNIKVTYTAGFITIPEDIQEGCAQTCAWLHANASAAANIQGWKLGDVAVNYFKFDQGMPMLPAVIRQLLATYRKVEP